MFGNLRDPKIWPGLLIKLAIIGAALVFADWVADKAKGLL